MREAYLTFVAQKIMEATEADELNDDFMRIEFLLNNIPTLSYEQAIKNKEQLSEVGNLYVRNSFGLILLQDLLNYYTNSDQEIVVDYVFPEAFGKPFGLKWFNKATKETFVKQYKHYKNPELVSYMKMFKHFYECPMTMFDNQSANDYEHLRQILTNCDK